MNIYIVIEQTFDGGMGCYDDRIGYYDSWVKACKHINGFLKDGVVDYDCDEDGNMYALVMDEYVSYSIETVRVQ